MENCNTNTTVVPDNTPLECNEYKSTNCILHPVAIPFFNLPINASQKDINTALIVALEAALNRIEQLENQ